MKPILAIEAACLRDRDGSAMPGILSFLIQANERFEVHVFPANKSIQDWLIQQYVDDCVSRPMANEADFYRAQFGGFVKSQLKWDAERPEAEIYLEDGMIARDGEWQSFTPEEFQAVEWHGGVPLLERLVG